MKHRMKYSIRHGIYAACLFAGLLISASTQAQFRVSGTITDKESRVSLPGAHISLGNDPVTTISDPQGRFLFPSVKAGRLVLKVSFVGYKTLRRELTIRRDTSLSIEIEGGALLGEEVSIVSTRAQEKYPTAYSSISNAEIRKANLGRDIPYLIQGSPSTVVTSDAGNGIGYSGISIRGTDLTRINVTINSIPLNDAESQGVWFVDLPDLASSAADIQIQRGVGTSTNGAGAFGATINFMTSDLHQDPYGELDLSGGSFNTVKSTLRFGTGLISGKFSVDGRFSYIRSDGYIDRAFSNLKSYYLSGGYYGKKTTLRLITFSGQERTYQAWEGVPKDSLATNRTCNPAGIYYLPDSSIAYYGNQTDNYQQDHYQLLFSRKTGLRWNINAALHYTHGRGFYENYKQDASLSDYGLNDVVIDSLTITTTDLVNRKMMDNRFYGITFSANYSLPDKLKLTAGGAWNKYEGNHFGKVIWATYASNGNNDLNWYENSGIKTDFNLYAKANYQLVKKISLFADIQYRHVSYSMNGALDNLSTLDQHHRFDFFNPKCGVFYTVNKHNDLFFSFGIANREPSRNNYKDADPGQEPTKETLCDYELGYNFKASWFTAGANIYYMDYKNQLVLTGKINNVGEAVMVNVPHSYRTGIELSAAFDFFKKVLSWNITGTFSSNKIRDFIHYTDQYDSGWNYIGQREDTLGTTELSFSPSITAASSLTYKPLKWMAVSLNSKYVGRQYLDNTMEKSRSLDGYFINGASLYLTAKTRLFDEIGFTVTVNNLFGVKYETNGWVYPYYKDALYYESNGYFPQALINFLAGITLKI